MKKIELDLLCYWSAEYVIAHAKWQKSRKRMPSAVYRGERNPKKALAKAKEMFLDKEFEDKIIISTNNSSTNGSSITTEDGWSFFINNFYH